MRQSLKERLAAHAAHDSFERLEKLYTDLLNGVPKNQSAYATDAADSAAWDRMAARIERGQAAGLTFDFSMFYGSEWD